MGPLIYKWDPSFINGMPHLYKWDPSFINEDIYVSLAQMAPHNVDMMTRGGSRAEMLASRGTYRVAIQQRMAARRALEWIGASKARLVFRYEISDLFRTR